MDPRLTPANANVAAAHLRGQVAAAKFFEGHVRRVVTPLADLRRAPDGPRDRQLLLGEAVTVYQTHAGWAFLQASRDGFVGYVKADCLGQKPDPTHWVTGPASHAYCAPDIKSPEIHAVSFGSQISVAAELRHFFETTDGHFIPKKHLWPLEKRFADPVLAAQLHFGVPYLWGGNSIWGIDCSGLVQAALLAAGLDCPGDSDLQENGVGAALDMAAPMQRGDLVFWTGHAAMMVDADIMIHANAHAMAVTYEPLSTATLRIKAQGGGPVTSRRRF